MRVMASAMKTIAEYGERDRRCYLSWGASAEVIFEQRPESREELAMQPVGMKGLLSQALRQDHAWGAAQRLAWLGGERDGGSKAGSTEEFCSPPGTVGARWGGMESRL